MQAKRRRTMPAIVENFVAMPVEVVGKMLDLVAPRDVAALAATCVDLRRVTQPYRAQHLLFLSPPLQTRIFQFLSAGDVCRLALVARVCHRFVESHRRELPLRDAKMHLRFYDDNGDFVKRTCWISMKITDVTRPQPPASVDVETGQNAARFCSLGLQIEERGRADTPGARDGNNANAGGGKQIERIVKLPTKELLSAKLHSELRRFHLTHLHVEAVPERLAGQFVAIMKHLYRDPREAPPPSVYMCFVELGPVKVVEWKAMLRTMAKGVGMFTDFVMYKMYFPSGRFLLGAASNSGLLDHVTRYMMKRAECDGPPQDVGPILEKHVLQANGVWQKLGLCMEETEKLKASRWISIIEKWSTSEATRSGLEIVSIYSGEGAIENIADALRERFPFETVAEHFAVYCRAGEFAVVIFAEDEYIFPMLLLKRAKANADDCERVNRFLFECRLETPPRATGDADGNRDWRVNAAEQLRRFLFDKGVIAEIGEPFGETVKGSE